MTDTEYAKAIKVKAMVANLEINAALTTEQQAQIGQDFIADIMELSACDSKQKALTSMKVDVRMGGLC
ncbi:hypothetical protein HZI70_02010 [Lactiplantibacillus plantarum]|uniref:hypothetical protein n=2 Tax=Lactiplantibacillus plantarum TaxID=1590 RepID=UPI001FCDDF2C|nr:hypothetical protein [Lactiplantibacillus plantarum]MCJ2382905.1 hypothetical protein [Lactiplantibacillus plantarum]